MPLHGSAIAFERDLRFDHYWITRDGSESCSRPAWRHNKGCSPTLVGDEASLAQAFHRCRERRRAADLPMVLTTASLPRHHWCK